MKGLSAETGIVRSRYGTGSRKASQLLKKARQAAGTKNRPADMKAMAKYAKQVIGMAKASKSQVKKAALWLAVSRG